MGGNRKSFEHSEKRLATNFEISYANEDSSVDERGLQLSSGSECNQINRSGGKSCAYNIFKVVKTSEAIRDLIICFVLR